MALQTADEGLLPPCVVCVGTSADELAAVVRAIERPTVVLLAPDVASAYRFLGNQGAATPSPLSTHTVHQVGPLTVDEEARTVTWHGAHVELSAHEFDLLTILASDAERAWTFAELSERVWRVRYLGDPEVVISAVKRLRRRLDTEAPGLRVEAVRGVGFRLAVAAPDLR